VPAASSPSPSHLPSVFADAEVEKASQESSASHPYSFRPLHDRHLSADEAKVLWREPIGTWLTSHVGAEVPSNRALPQRGCAESCGSHGSCNEQLGVCQCTSGWAGSACSRRQEWPCNAPDGRYLWSRCAGECDTRYGYCYCGKRGTYADRQLIQCEPRGIERALTPWKLDPRNEGERHPWEAIWGRASTPGTKPGWCDANASIGQVPAAQCACRYDGRDGYLCQHEVPMFCLNQCNFRGTCEHGFCICSEGWWGVDCSIRTSTGVSGAILPPEVTKAAGPVGPAVTPPRVRPLIYVYEMPQRFTTDLLQRRHDKMFCVHRTYLRQNQTQFAYGIYQGYVLEVLVHEWLLSSAHRTTNPAEADFFYVPVYATCAMVTAIFETPRSKKTK
jgi:hypothetical protein